MAADYTIAIRDVNGITIDGETHYVNEVSAAGAWIDLGAYNFDILYKPLTDEAVAPGKTLTKETTFESRLGSFSVNGFNPPSFNISCLIDMEHEAVNPVKHTVNSVDYYFLTYPLLHNLVTVPNVYYLKDYVGASATYRPPINALMNTVDFYDTSTWGDDSKVVGSNGIPVAVKNCKVIRRQNSEQGHFITANLELVWVNV